MKNEARAARLCSTDSPGKRVLVVDDDPEILTILSVLLNRLGYEVSEAVNGKQALEIFQQNRFVLVVTDLQMPLMDGLTLMAKVKAISRRTPVVVITGKPDTEVEQTAGMTLADAVLYKPFHLDTLEQTLARVVK